MILVVDDDRSRRSRNFDWCRSCTERRLVDLCLLRRIIPHASEKVELACEEGAGNDELEVDETPREKTTMQMRKRASNT